MKTYIFIAFLTSTWSFVLSEWVLGRPGEIPDNAWLGGYNSKNEPLYICQARHGKIGIFSGSYNPRNGTCVYAAFGVRQSGDFNVLVHNNNINVKYSWMTCSGSSFKKEGKVVGGQILIGLNSPLYVGRVAHRATRTPGFIASGNILAAVDQEEVHKNDYECLARTEAFSDPSVWVSSSSSHVPNNAVVGGSDINNQTLYICQVSDGGNVLVGKFNPRRQVCSVPWEDGEKEWNSFRVLVSTWSIKYTWSACKVDQNLPKNIVSAGEIKRGKEIVSLFVGRAFTHDTTLPGWIANGIIHVGLSNNEITKSTYECLVAGIQT